MQVTGKGAKFLDRLGIAVGGPTHPMLFSPHIDAGGMRMEDGQVLRRGFVLLAFFGHRFLQSDEGWGEQGKTGLLLSKDTIVGGVLRAAILFHLERIDAQRWRDANKEMIMFAFRSGLTPYFLKQWLYPSILATALLAIGS